MSRRALVGASQATDSVPYAMRRLQCQLSLRRFALGEAQVTCGGPGFVDLATTLGPAFFSSSAVRAVRICLGLAPGFASNSLRASSSIARG